ncbi:hypothetical protein KP22_14545 [Pectobacterium betavasculorum]|uniref:Uncharacterized protein n=1 Tax=Pectobacterium betavasculorum TaxID=55207 RepID=A0A093RU97_9GAMM|nr:hypothetical protein [Pectobacterium betavasculorum]KFX04064.1 hypothetical protein KP22_14545 [Pectobacterium betavasculorum]
MDLQWNYSGFWNEARRNLIGPVKDVVDEMTSVLEQPIRLTHFTHGIYIVFVGNTSLPCGKKTYPP